MWVREPYIAQRARKHGVADSAIVHAFNNPVRYEELDESLLMLIGPDEAGNLLELGVITSDDGPIVVHAMAARPKYLR